MLVLIKIRGVEFECFACQIWMFCWRWFSWSKYLYLVVFHKWHADINFLHRVNQVYPESSEVCPPLWLAFMVHQGLFSSFFLALLPACPKPFWAALSVSVPFWLGLTGRGLCKQSPQCWNAAPISAQKITGYPCTLVDLIRSPFLVLIAQLGLIYCDELSRARENAGNMTLLFLLFVAKLLFELRVVTQTGGKSPFMRDYDDEKIERWTRSQPTDIVPAFRYTNRITLKYGLKNTARTERLVRGHSTGLAKMR